MHLLQDQKISHRVLSLEEPEALLFLERLESVYGTKVRPMIFRHVDRKPNVASLISSSRRVVADHLQSAPQTYSVGCLVIVGAYHSLVQWLRGQITGLVILGLYGVLNS
jgi:hypothetical protein